MPINYKHYHPKWKLIGRLIRRRSGNRCERCGVANGFIGKRTVKGDIRNLSAVEWDMYQAKLRNQYSPSYALKRLGFTRVVLTVAHIDHNHNNNRFANLQHLCQACHMLQAAKVKY